MGAIKMKKLIALVLTSVFWSSIGDLMALEVSGHTDKGVYVSGDLDVDSSGNVDGYVNTSNGKAIHVEGEIQDKNTVEINSDSWDGGGYELDIDSW
jgi:hypothetical protein